MATTDPTPKSSASAPNSLRILLLSLFLGAAATAVIYFYLQDRILQLTGGQSVQVIFTNTAIAAGSPVRESMLEVRSIPKNFLHYSAVLASDKPLLAGQIVANNLAAGQPLLWTDIQLVTSESLSQRLGSDERAITIPIDPVSGVSGFIRPGDRVDILSTTSAPDPKTGRPTPITRMLLQNVTVLAVGTNTATPTLTGSADPGSPSTATPPVSRTAQPAAPPPARNVTLKVSPEEAAIITFAEQRGELRLLLRSRTDVVVRDIPDVDASRLLQFNDVDASRARQQVEGYPTIVEGTNEPKSGFSAGPTVPSPGITPADAAARMQEAQRMREQLIRQLQQGSGPSTPDLRNLPPEVREKFLEGVRKQPRGTDSP
ncbi:MAG: hypothetical protein OHK005_04230 [Candidatus Methylacidiphilales bacterium]